MCTTAKTDFEPALDLPIIQPTPWTSRLTPLLVAVVCCLLGLAVVAYIEISHNSISKRSPLNQGVSANQGFCVGYEAICSTSTTDKPAEALAKLAATLPQGQPKHRVRYRVKVSVVPLEGDAG
jgi:hypothetical protein